VKKPDRLVGNWILFLAFMVFGMVEGGGHARTINAGYTIQVWLPFTGFIPPRTDADWAQLFGLFRQTSQYQAMHPPISLVQFKALFWPMFWDRVWGRVMALVLLIPLAVLLFKARISPRLGLWLLALFAAGAGQAAYGWEMVRTGMEPGVISVPPEWLAPHFVSGMLIFIALLWTGLSVRNPVPVRIETPEYLKHWLTSSIILILCTMGLGALVAATNAVSVFNTFPKMDGHWVPLGFYKLHPLWLNFIANQATVQFDHRVLATLTALSVLITAGLGLRETLPPKPRDAFLLLAGLVALQYLLGMITIVSGSAELGYVHELNAVLLLAAAVLARHSLRGAAGRPMLASGIAAAE
jgi:cytochrome c oxidase assembly protein subunit 15